MKKIALFVFLMALYANVAQAKFSYWGYCSKEVSSQYGSSTSGKAAIYIPAEVARLYVGLQVTGVRVGLNADASEMTTFITTDLNASPIASKKSETSNAGLNAVTKFDTPYTITGEGFYVGYEYKGSNKSLGCSSAPNASGNGNWTNLGSGWVNGGTSAKALNIQARIEGDKLPVDLNLVEVKDVAVKKDTPFRLMGTIVNQSATKAYTYDIAYSIDGGEERVVSFTDAPIGERSDASFSITCDGVSAGGNHTIKARIVSVDGTPDAYDGNNTATASLLTTTISAVKRAYMEEMTGLMCGWCPRGIASIDACLEAYPDNFVVVAKHNYYISTPEELKSPTYDYDADGNTTWPYCTIDRIWAFDPIPSTAMAAVEQSINRGTVVALDAKGSFVPGDKSHINARAIAQFTTSLDNVNYRFGFALVENGVTGYTQNNNYSGGSNGAMGGWENKSSMATVTLNHVARMGYSVKDGIERSIPENVSQDSPVSYDVVLDVPSTVKNADNLKLIAIIINKSNGTIENAVQVDITDGAESGISDLGTTPSPDVDIVDGKVVAEGFDGTISVYTIDGKQTVNRSLTKGFYIVRGVNAKQSFVKKIRL